VQALFLVASTQISEAKMTVDFVAWIVSPPYWALVLVLWELSLKPLPLPGFVLIRVACR
jgi:hypothetical protein